MAIRHGALSGGLISHSGPFRCKPFLLAVAMAFSPSYAQTSAAPETIRFGGDAIYPPFEWFHKGEAKGFNVDLAKAMGRVDGTRVVYELEDWPDVISGLEDGRLDVVAMFVSQKRAEKFAFSSPFHIVSHAIYASTSTEPVYVADKLAGRRVAVEDRSYAQQQFRELQIDIIPVLTDNTLGALKALEDGRATYAVLGIPSADRLIRDRDLPLRKLGPPFWSSPYGFAVRRDRTELLAWVQNTLDAVIASGAYQSVYGQWEEDLPYSQPPHDQTPQTFIVAAAAALSLAILACFARLHYLRRRAELRSDYFRRRTSSAEVHAAHLSNNDADTGLPKTSHFIAKVDRLLATVECDSRALCRDMLVVEFTQRGELGNTLGRDAYERLIREFANSLSVLCPGPVGYLGRGVFAMYASHESIGEVRRFLLSRRATSDQARLVSGSACFPEHGKTAAELLQHAETALTVSRSTGRRWTAYCPSMEPDEADLEIISCFRSGRLEGLYPIYQPKIDLVTGAIAGAEALVRWNHPTLGFLPPAKFIPLAEKAGFVFQVTARMIDEAVRFSCNLRQQELPSPISVNITISDLTETDLVDIIQQALDRHGGRAEDLELELTETSVASDIDYVKDVLTRLHDLGICLSVDDFGTGYSSLSYISYFPIHEVKIDRSFVVDVVSNSTNRSIVRSTILMAKELNLRTVAEGAEDLETQKMLTEFGCDRLQGYVFSKPLPQGEYMLLLREHAKSLLVP